MKRIQNNKISWIPNRWDAIALLLVLSMICLLAWGALQMTAPYTAGEKIHISLSPSVLPLYALRTVLRMLIALFFSLLFAFVFATWAAKSRRAERIIIPLIDILQSVPVLGFLSVAIVFFIRLFPNSLLGPECASIFVVFTAQAWNIALGFFQTLRSVPNEYQELSTMYHLSAWQSFWRIQVPFSLPSLLWNSMVSMSASWFFVVQSEAIAVSNQQISLPGIGSYIALASATANVHAVIYALIAMFLVIFIYDQLLFRPLLSLAELFKGDSMDEESDLPWLADVFKRTVLFIHVKEKLVILFDQWVNLPLFNRHEKLPASPNTVLMNRFFALFFYLLVIVLVVASAVFTARFMITHFSWKEILMVFKLGAFTAIRVLVLIVLSSLIWVPLGIGIGLRPRLRRFIQPISQFLASFPANLLFPLVVMVIVHYHLNVEIWTAPLMILGAQWYILFNVIAGASAIPKDLTMAAQNYNLRGWLWWKRYALPGVFPYYVTGAMTAAGGAWNASIVAEVVSWGKTSLVAKGLGAYITLYTSQGDFPRIALGISVMCIYVLAFNRVLWRPLYTFAISRFKLD